MRELHSFLKGVKNGDIRGDFVQKTVADNILVELSVGSFQYGCAHLRVIVDEPRLDVREDTYYRRLYRVDDMYKDVHESVQKVIQAENETPVKNAHVWQAPSQEHVKNHPSLPDRFDKDSTAFFEEHIQLRDDVTIIEALETNRSD